MANYRDLLCNIVPGMLAPVNAKLLTQCAFSKLCWSGRRRVIARSPRISCSHPVCTVVGKLSILQRP